MNAETLIAIPYGYAPADLGIAISSYWNGEPAENGRHFSASLSWNDDSLVVQFRATIGEPLVISASPTLTEKTIGLWERDVCEIFIAPDKIEPQKYFEFEIAPTGEWLDLAIDSTSGERVTDWDYNSRMTASARMENDRVRMTLSIPWEALGRKPKPGDVWLGNMLRCVGKDPNRGYLAWRPTMTQTPNFHVPEAFGQMVFLPANNADQR